MVRLKIGDRTNRTRKTRRRFGFRTCISAILLLAVALLVFACLKLRVSSELNIKPSSTPAVQQNIFFYGDGNSQHSNPLDSESLPNWIRNYLKWHQEMRAAFPGMKLINDPGAPKLIVRTCVDVICGGLNDRLGQLPWDLYLANQTGRLLLMHWHMPVHLENFLLPNELDWRIPREMAGFFSQKEGEPLTWDDQKLVMKTYPDLFRDYRSGRPSSLFFDEQVDQAIKRAVSGEFRDEKLLRHRMLGHMGEENLEQRLQKLGETDTLHWTPSFGIIFRMFFKPSLGLNAEIRAVYDELQLVPARYSAVHCRVRHPKATSSKVNVIGKDGETVADISGLPWIGELREFAVQTAVRALKCARSLIPPSLDATDAEEPIYFFSDSNDLAHYMAHQLNDADFLKANATLLKTNPVDAQALETVQSFGRVVSRDASLANIHIDRLKGFPAADYYSTFVDVILAANAHCVTYGVGNYALFATKLSSTSCRLLYAEELWGGTGKKLTHTRQCQIK